MASRFEDARFDLYGVPLSAFVDQRKRGAAALKAEGDKEGARRMAKLARPSISAWVVNQLWRQERSSFDQLFATAERIRAGDPTAARSHREVTATMRDRAAVLLVGGDHAASEITLRRVAIDLAALAARGGFAPDPEGVLATDLDAPGFDVSIAGEVASVAATAKSPAGRPTAHTAGQEAPASLPKDGGDRAGRIERDRERAAATAKAKAEAEAKAEEAERLRLEAERLRLEAERARLDADIRAAKNDLESHQHRRERLREELKIAEAEVKRAEANLRAAESRRIT